MSTKWSVWLCDQRRFWMAWTLAFADGPCGCADITLKIHAHWSLCSCFLLEQNPKVGERLEFGVFYLFWADINLERACEHPSFPEMCCIFSEFTTALGSSRFFPLSILLALVSTNCWYCCKKWQCLKMATNCCQQLLIVVNRLFLTVVFKHGFLSREGSTGTPTCSCTSCGQPLPQPCLHWENFEQRTWTKSPVLVLHFWQPIKPAFLTSLAYPRARPGPELLTWLDTIPASGWVHHASPEAHKISSP